MVFPAFVTLLHWNHLFTYYLLRCAIYVIESYLVFKKRDVGGNEYDTPSSLVRPVLTQSLYQCSNPDGLTNYSRALPPAEEVERHANQVTKCIQELWTTMQDLEKRDAFVPCAERIRSAVAELSAIFPQVNEVCFKN